MIGRPLLAAHVRYRWDAVRDRHVLLYPEGVMMLNDTAAAVVRRCDGRSSEALLLDLKVRYPDVKVEEVGELLEQLGRRGLVLDRTGA